MSNQIESGVKVLVSAALALVLTLTVMTGIGGAGSQEMAKQAARDAQIAAHYGYAG